MKNEGVPAFFKGLDAVFFRLSSWNCIMFVCLEQIKRHYYDPTQDDWWLLEKLSKSKNEAI